MGTPVRLRFLRRGLHLASLLLVGLSACSGEETPGSAAPVQAVEPRTREIPAGLRIEVEIDGEPAAPIDSALLGRVRPAHEEGGRRSWRLGSLLGAAYAPSSSLLEVETADGVTTSFPRRARAGGWEPVVVLNRRGELLVGLRSSDADARAFHGRGGNRGRPGAPRRQIRNVTKLRLQTRGGGSGMAPGSRMRGQAALVTVFVDGERRASWTPSALSAVNTVALAGQRGGGTRPQEAWSLRDLVHNLIGPDQSVTQLQGKGGRVLELKPEDWRDPGKIPLLRQNRRGEFKFEWLTASGKPTPGVGLRGVSEIHLSRESP